jgi:hypothetical protein
MSPCRSRRRAVHPEELKQIFTLNFFNSVLPFKRDLKERAVYPEELEKIFSLNFLKSILLFKRAFKECVSHLLSSFKCSTEPFPLSYRRVLHPNGFLSPSFRSREAARLKCTSCFAVCLCS